MAEGLNLRLLGNKGLILRFNKAIDSILASHSRKVEILLGFCRFVGRCRSALRPGFSPAPNVVQGRHRGGGYPSDVGRFAINTTIGVLGIVDVASSLGLEKHEEDFGQTFGRWGFGNGPYLVLPFFGPSTLRDATGLAVDLHVDPLGNYSDVPARNIMIATRTLNDRAGLLPVDKIVDEAALDRYAYIRDAYLQRRRSQVYDGDAPREDDNAAATLTPPTTLLLARANAALPQRERVQGSVNLYVEWPTETPAATVMARPAPLLTDPLVLAQIH